MAQLFKNNSGTALASGITDVQLTFDVTDASQLPAITAPDWCWATITQAASETAWEIVKITDITGNTLTVERAQQSTTAQIWSAGSKLSHRATAVDFGIPGPQGDPGAQGPPGADGADGTSGQPLHGVSNRDSLTLSYSSVTRQVTITGAAEIYILSTLYTLTNPTVSTAHTNATAGYFLYLDELGALTWSTTPWDLYDHAPICYVFYDATLAEGIAFYELHEARRDPSAHKRLHEVDGTQAINTGFAVTGYVLNSDLDADKVVAIASGTVADEDIRVSVSALNEAGPYTIMWRTGASGVWTWTKTDVVPFKHSGTDIEYNQFTGATWQRTALSGTQFVNIWVFALPALETAFKLIFVVGQAVHSSQSAAESEAISSLSWGTMPFQEIAPLYQLTYRRAAGNGNTGKADLRRVARLAGSRNTIVATGASPTTAAAVTFVPAGNLSSTTVQAALEELDTEKLAASAASVYGLTLLDDVDAATARTTLGLGTAAVANTGDFDAAGAAAAAQAASQPLDADLTAIAALSGTGGWAKRTAANTWTISTPTYTEVGADAAGSAAAAQAASQPLDADLTAIAALSGTGGWAKRTAANTWTISTPTYTEVGADAAGAAAAAQAASQPLDADLTAIAALTATGGWAKRTAADTWAISTPTAADVGADAAGSAAAAQAASQPLDTQLTSLAGLTYTGNTLKVVRVNAGETGFELATPGAAATAAADVTFTPAGNIAATNVQAALQELDSEKISTSAATVFGLSLLDDADASAGRTTLGLGTAAVAATGDFDAAGAAAAAQAASQPLDADLTAIAALSGTGGWAKRTAANTWTISTPTAADVGADAAGAAAAAQAASQPLDADLTAIAALSATGGWAKRTAANTWTISTPTYTEVGADAAGAAAAAQAASQPLDADLTAIAALSATGGWAKRTAADTWTISTPTYTEVGADAAGAAAAAQAASQPLDATLTALAGLNATAGLVEQTAADTFAKRAIGVAATTDILTRADGDGRYDAAGAAAAAQAASQPLDADLTAIAALSGTGGWAKRTAANTWTISTPTYTEVGADAAGAAAAAQAASQPLDAQLTSLAALAYTGNTLKVVRVNAGETDFELATIAAGASSSGAAGLVQVSDGAGGFSAETGFGYDAATNQATVPGLTLTEDMILSGSINATISAATDNWAPTGHATATVIRANPDYHDWYITGLTAGSAGQIKIIENVSTAYDFRIIDESASSTAANRFKLPKRVNGAQSIGWISLTTGESATFIYDGTDSRWRLIAITGQMGSSFYVENIGTGNLTIQPRYYGKILEHGGGGTITLGANTLGLGKWITIKCDQNASDPTIVSTSGGTMETVAADGLTGRVYRVMPGQVITFYNDNSYWQPMGENNKRIERRTMLLSPTALSADTNSWNPTGILYSNYIRVSNTTAVKLTGLDANDGAAGRYNRIYILENVSANALTLTHDDSNSTATHRFQNPGGQSIVLAQHESACYAYGGSGAGLAAWVLQWTSSKSVNGLFSQKTASYTTTALDFGGIVEVNAAGATTQTLMTAVGYAGKSVTIKNIGAGLVTMASTSSQTIDGASAGGVTILQHASRTFYSDGANWRSRDKGFGYIRTPLRWYWEPALTTSDKQPIYYVEAPCTLKAIRWYRDDGTTVSGTTVLVLKKNGSTLYTLTIETAAASGSWSSTWNGTSRSGLTDALVATDRLEMTVSTGNTTMKNLTVQLDIEQAVY